MRMFRVWKAAPALTVGLTMALWSSCGGSGGGGDQGPAGDGYVFPEVGYDANSTDTSSEVEDVQDSGTLDAGTDSGPPPECPDKNKEAGCLCQDNDDCTYGFCIATEMGQICVDPCQDECPSGWSCSSVEIGAEIFYLCLPRFSKLCQPCGEHTQCQAKSESHLALCLDYGDAGSFCGAYCDDTHPCPDGYSCEDRVLGDGTETQQCLASGGACVCNQLGSALGMSTTCHLTNEHGSCPGTRVCDEKGLGECDAEAPAPEECNGKDDDCDGVTDNLPPGKGCTIENEFGKCPGTLACVGTVELCAGEQPKPEVCDGLDNDCNGHTDDGFGDFDDDGLADCVDPDMDGDGVGNDADNCIQVENPGQEDLDKDGKGDACDPDTDGDGYVDVTDCLPLDVFSFPGATEQCDGKDNDCNGATDEVVCDDSIDCTFDYCEPVTKSCGHAPDDSKCDDANECTQDLCDAEKGCVANPVSGIQCDDGNKCTVGDACEAGTCVGTPAAGCCVNAADCDDGNSCTIDSCNVDKGECSYLTLADESACDADTDGCTVGDSCWKGICVPGPRPFCGPDDSICAKNACFSTGPDTYECGTSFATDDTPCDDDLFCTVDDHCDGEGACTGGGPKLCPEQEGGCMVGACDDALDECLLKARPDGEACNSDDDGCTDGDSCQGGACVPGSVPDCSAAAQAPCEMGGCVSLGPAYFTCVNQPKPEGAACENGDFCTVADTCDSKGECVAGLPRDCDSEVGDQCHLGVCDDYMQECIKWKAGDGTPCDDGDSCTTTDTCENGFCVGSTDVCVAEKISIEDKGLRQPTIASLGSGRYVTQWFGTGGYGTRENRMRLSDAHGSRENEEVTLAPIKTGRQFRTGIAVTPTGSFLVMHWGGVNACNQVNCNACTAIGSFTGSLYRWDGKLMQQKALVDFSLATGAGCDAFLDVDDALAVPMAFSDGTFGLVESYGVTGSQALGDVDRPPLEIRYTMAAGDLTAGTTVTLVQAADVGSASGFDAIQVPGSNDDFLLAWIDSTGRGIKAQRLSRTGSSGTPAWNVVQVPDPGVIDEVSLATWAGGGFVVLYEEVDGAGGVRSVRGRRFDTSGSPVGDTFDVDPSQGSDRRLGEVAAFSDGGFVVAFDAENGDLDGWAVRAVTYDAAGIPETGPILVNTLSIGDQYMPAVEVLDGDEWVVAFVDSDSAVWTRRFDRYGDFSVGRPELPSNTTTSGSQSDLELGLAGGNRVMAAYESPQFGAEGQEVLARVFDVQGHEVTAEFTVNQVHVGDQRNPVVDGGDGFLLAWESVDQDGSGIGIFARRFGNDGDPIGDEFGVNPTTALDQTEPCVERSASGDALFTWTGDMDGSGADTDVFAIIRGADGSLVKDEFQVNTTTSLRQEASVAVSSPTQEGYIVVWESENQDGYSFGVYARRFDASGNPVTGEVLVNQTTVFPQRHPTVSVSPDGVRLLACWTSSVSYTYDVVCRILNFADLSGAVDEFSPLVPSNVNQQEPHVSYLQSGEFLVTWSASDVDGSGTAVQLQRYTDEALAFGPRIQGNRTFVGDQRNPFVLPINSNLVWLGWDSFGQDGDQDGGVFRVLPVQ